jgi:pimeloyl-ACP methyl ester carboxylesterase
MSGRISYDEFAYFAENVAEFGLAASATPVVRRITHRTRGGATLSALQWGVASPRVVLVHGGAQNAHTWDTVALDLDVPLLAVDLPGHGHSSWRDDGDYGPATMAGEIGSLIEEVAPDADVVVGMSLGGLTSLSLAAQRADLVRRLVLVDITPGVTDAKAKAITDFVNGPQSFPSFDELLRRTIEHNPTRSESSLRRGILHNAVQLDDLTWRWRYDRRSHPDRPGRERIAEGLWEVLEATSCPVALVRGALSPVVDDADVAEFLRRRPDAVVHLVDGAGHSVQGDRPRDMSRIIRDMLP